MSDGGMSAGGMSAGGAVAATLPAGTAVAVTGATGFIGGRLVEMLAADGAAVTCLVRGDPGSRVRATGSAVRAVDLADPEQVRRALAGAAVVFHCAYDWGDELWNHGAMRALIAGCAAHRCRLIQLSSFVVYEIPSAGELTEAAPAATASGGYAHTKLALERELLGAAGRGEVAASVLQPTIVYGPHSRPWAIDPADMLRHGTVVLPDQGEGSCNAVFVDDVVGAMMLAATHEAALGQRFLISGPAPVTWADFYGGIAQAIGASGPQFRPADEIAAEATGRRKLKATLTDPERLLRRIAFIGSNRKLVTALTGQLPAGPREQVRGYLYGPEARWKRHVHLPDPGRVRFLQGTAAVRSAKARGRIGYAPRFDLPRGLAATGAWLRARG